MPTMVVSGRAQAREACSCTASTRMQRRSLERLFIMLASWGKQCVWGCGRCQQKGKQRLLFRHAVICHFCVLHMVWRQLQSYGRQYSFVSSRQRFRIRQILSQIQIIDRCADQTALQLPGGFGLCPAPPPLRTAHLFVMQRLQCCQSSQLVQGIEWDLWGEGRRRGGFCARTSRGRIGDEAADCAGRILKCTCCSEGSTSYAKRQQQFHMSVW